MSCCVCQKSKTTLTCGICKGELCKPCTEFVEPEQFSYLSKTPQQLTHTTYCSTCYAEVVAPAVLKYDETLAQAREILVYDRTQKKETRLLSRQEPELKITDQADYDDAILRLAFWAVEKGFNSIIDLDLKSKKITDGRYQHLVWSGSARPTQVSDRKLVKDRSIWSNPN